MAAAKLKYWKAQVADFQKRLEHMEYRLDLFQRAEQCLEDGWFTDQERRDLNELLDMDGIHAGFDSDREYITKWLTTCKGKVARLSRSKA